MSRQIRPWYRPHIDWYCVVWIFIGCAALLGSIEIIRRGYVPGFLLSLAAIFTLYFAIKGLWVNRNLWVFETHKGREITVRRHFRDEYDVCINGRCTRVYAELGQTETGKYDVALHYDSIRQWRTSPMTEEERVDVLHILLEQFEMWGKLVQLFGDDIPDSPLVRSTRVRWEKAALKRR